jgi:tartrate dehydratase alpha subunit/fumarate hydratase class I-like protein
MLPDFGISHLSRGVKVLGLSDLGVLKGAEEIILAACPADFLKVVIGGLEIDAALLNQPDNALARNLARQQGNDLHLRERFLLRLRRWQENQSCEEKDNGRNGMVPHARLLASW